MFFGSFEGRGSLRKLLIADVQIQTCTVGELAAGAFHHLLQHRLRTLKFLRLESLHSGFEVLHSLCKTRIGLGGGTRERRFRGLSGSGRPRGMSLIFL